jgi:CheY-like chemotaxis protein
VKKGEDGSSVTICRPVSDKKGALENERCSDTVRGKGTILLVDDDDMVGDVTQQMLEHLGYSVIIARSGPEALEVYRVKGKEIDAVILDMVMPGMCGGETFDLLKRANRDIKVIVASGYGPNAEVSKMLDRGCGAFIQKPFSMGVVAQKVKEVLDNK